MHHLILAEAEREQDIENNLPLENHSFLMNFIRLHPMNR